jgi:hypothetical protein
MHYSCGRLARDAEKRIDASVATQKGSGRSDRETELACSIMSVLLSFEEGETKDVFTCSSQTF